MFFFLSASFVWNNFCSNKHRTLSLSGNYHLSLPAFTRLACGLFDEWATLKRKMNGQEVATDICHVR